MVLNRTLAIAIVLATPLAMQLPLSLALPLLCLELGHQNDDRISGEYLHFEGYFLPIPGEAKAKAMPGRLYIHTK